MYHSIPYGMHVPGCHHIKHIKFWFDLIKFLMKLLQIFVITNNTVTRFLAHLPLGSCTIISLVSIKEVPSQQLYTSWFKLSREASEIKDYNSRAQNFCSSLNSTWLRLPSCLFLLFRKGEQAARSQSPKISEHIFLLGESKPLWKKGGTLLEILNSLTQMKASLKICSYIFPIMKIIFKISQLIKTESKRHKWLHLKKLSKPKCS